jgi:uncharacterized membrane protein
MENQKQSSKAMHIILWIAQLILAAFLLIGAVMKFMPIEKIAPLIPWTGELQPVIVRLLGCIDLLGAIGLIIPALLRIKPQLTKWSAIGIIALMVSAITFHILRGEASVIGFNILIVVIAIFIAWGREKKAPIEGK